MIHSTIESSNGVNNKGKQKEIDSKRLTLSTKGRDACLSIHHNLKNTSNFQHYDQADVIIRASKPNLEIRWESNE